MQLNQLSQLAGYMLDRAQVVRALDARFEVECRTLKLMAATLLRKLSEARRLLGD